MRALLALLCCSAAALCGQNTPSPAAPQAAVERSMAQEVMVDVVVRDKKGRPVRDLRPGELLVTDNGQRVVTKGFRLVEGESARDVRKNGSASVALNGNVPAQRQIRLISLVFDRLGNDGRNLARTAALDVLSRPLDADTYVAVFAIDHRLGVVQPFTNNVDLLRGAVQRACTLGFDFGQQTRLIRQQISTLFGVPENDAVAFRNKTENLFQSAKGFLSPGSNQPPGSPSALIDYLQMTTLVNAMESEQHQADQTQGFATLDALIAVIQNDVRLPGRKTILYFAEGLSLPDNMKPLFQKLVAAANRANVSVYALDARGLTSANENAAAVEELGRAADSSRHEVQGGLGDHQAVPVDQVTAIDRAGESIRMNHINPMADLAHSTGGFLVTGSNDLRRPVQRILEDVNTYYEVSYNPNLTSYDGSFHKLAVEVLRSGVSVQSRSGYFALPPSTRPEDNWLPPYEQALLRAISTRPAPAAFPYSSGVLDFRGATGPKIGLVLELPLDRITLVRDKDKDEYRLHLAALFLIRDAKGEVQARFARDLPSHGPLDKMQALRASEFIDARTASLPPGRYTLESAVVDIEGERASVNSTAFEVSPPSTGPVLSDIVLVRRLAEDSSAAKSSETPFVFGDRRVVPTLLQSVPAGSRIPVFVTVSPDPAHSEKPELLIELVRDGEAMRDETADFPDGAGSRALLFYGELSTTGLEPGGYQVRATLRQGEARVVKTRDLSLAP